MKFKMLNGTPDHSQPSLCFGCSNGQVIQGQTASNFTVRCLAHMSGEPLIIREPVTGCTEYARRWDQSLQSMKEIAHILVTKNGRAVGFLPPKQAADKIRGGTVDKIDPQVREVEDDV